MSEEELDRLRAENAELRRRIDEVGDEIDVLRAEALERRAAVRELAEALPTAMSRRTLLVQMASDVCHHPDKRGIAQRAVAKLARAPRKLARLVGARIDAARARR